MGVEGLEELKGETGTEDQPDPDVVESPEPSPDDAPPVPAPDTEPPVPDGDDQEAAQGTDVDPVDDDDLQDVPQEDGA